MKTKLSTSAFDSKYKLDIRQVVNYSPDDLFKRYTKFPYVIDYDVKLSNGLPLQRDFVWSIEQKRALIVSMLKELQLPNFLVVLYRADDSERTTTLKIIDGKQRLSTIEQFINGEFGLMLEDEEYFFVDLDVDAKRRINSYSLNFNIIYEYDDCKLSDAQLVSAFEYVNFAGTPQDIEHFDKLKTYIKE